jgi:uncharacterized protein (DUF1810 family)
MVAEGFPLDRFVRAQEAFYAPALAELRSGTKTSHWIWFVFPQLIGLGRSETARHFGIDGMEEAHAYLSHPVLAPRLIEATEAMLKWAGKREAEDILGQIDAMKFRSSMTLFAEAEGDDSLFAEALDAFFNGERDPLTLDLLGG